MLPIPKKVLGASLILAGVAGFSGCASKDMEISSLERLLSARQERIEDLEMLRSDMRRVIELKNAELERQKKDGMQVGHDGGSELMWRSVLCQANATPETVIQIQRALKQAYHYHGPLNGIDGPQTRRAVESYQRAKGLAVGGMTFETLGALGLKTPGMEVVAGAK